MDETTGESREPREKTHRLEETRPREEKTKPREEAKPREEETKPREEERPREEETRPREEERPREAVKYLQEVVNWPQEVVNWPREEANWPQEEAYSGQQVTPGVQLAYSREEPQASTWSSQRGRERKKERKGKKRGGWERKEHKGRGHKMTTCARRCQPDAGEWQPDRPVSRCCQCPGMDVGLRPAVDGNPAHGRGRSLISEYRDSGKKRN